jgi:hypothetical protein
MFLCMMEQRFHQNNAEAEFLNAVGTKVLLAIHSHLYYRDPPPPPQKVV